MNFNQSLGSNQNYWNMINVLMNKDTSDNREYVEDVRTVIRPQPCAKINIFIIHEQNSTEIKLLSWYCSLHNLLHRVCCRDVLYYNFLSKPYYNNGGWIRHDTFLNMCARTPSWFRTFLHSRHFEAAGDQKNLKLGSQTRGVDNTQEEIVQQGFCSLRWPLDRSRASKQRPAVQGSRGL